MLLLAGLIVALWVDAMGAHELARAHGRRLCDDAKLQLIDDSVALQRVRVKRAHGRLALLRRYRFDVSFDGTDRHGATITLLGRTRLSYVLPIPERGTPV